MNFNDENKKFLFMAARWMPQDPMELKGIIKKQNKVIGYEIGNEFFSKEKAILMAKEGKIMDIGVGCNYDNTEYLIKHPERINVDKTDIKVIEDELSKR